MNGIGFEHFSLIAIGAPLLGVAVLLHFVSPLQRFTPSLLRAAVCAVLLLLLSGPYTEEVIERKSVNVLVDLSDSINQQVLRQVVSEKLAELQRAGWEYTVFPFGGSLGEGEDELGFVDEVRAAINPEKTDLAGALLKLSEQSSRDIILFSDGVETSGSVLANLETIRGRGTRVYPQVSDALKKSQERVAIESLLLPLRREGGETVQGSVSFVSSSSQPEEGKIFIFQNGKLISDEAVTVPARGSLTRTLTVPQGDTDKDKVEVRFVPNDTLKNPQERAWFIHADEGDKVLILSQDPREARYLREVFDSANIEVSEELSDRTSGANVLGEYFAIIVNNVPYQELPRVVQREARSYVEAGGRFVLIGGNRAFGLGGYVNTDIDSILPVQSLTPRRELKRVNVAVQLVLDKSASMKYGQKIEFSKQAAREVVRNLKDPDYFGVIGFDTTPFIAFPIRRMAEFREMAVQRIGTLYAAGKTNLFPALDEARRGLVNVQAGRKHAIVLTDGKIPDEGPHYLQLIQQMRTNGITVSTVMMGAEADTRLLRTMAQYGGGSFYQTRDPSALPRIFLSDVQVSTKEQTLNEEENYVVRRSQSASQFSVSLLTFPSVRGYVETKEKRDEYVELVAVGNGKAVPLLATRPLGKGKTIAFTSDANGRWSSEWVGWRSFRQFWRELVLPKPQQGAEEGDGAELDFDLRWYREGGEIVLDLVVYEPVSSGVTLQIEGGAATREYTPKEVAEGRYQLRLDSQYAMGPLTVSGSAGKKSFGPLTLDISGDILGENRPVGLQMVLLSQLARDTSGEVNGLPDENATRKQVNTERDYFTTELLLLAFLLFALDIFMRTRVAAIRRKTFLRRLFV
ncbi:MAG: VWA domain-containing protein [Bdellovibrionales bacterium]|nr:VWA domain-containing protein [Bdellovibrionales bacterium]